MKIFLSLLTIFVLGLNITFSQIDEGVDEFGRKVFEVVKNNNKEQFIELFLVKEEVSEIARIVKENSETPPEKMIEDIENQLKKEYITENWNISNDDLKLIYQNAIEKYNIVWSQASYKETKIQNIIYKRGVSIGGFKIIYEFMGNEYDLNVVKNIKTQNGWKFGRFDVRSIIQKENSSASNYSKANILKLYITSIPSAKSNGNAWDNAFGQYLPDVYAKIQSETSVLRNTGLSSRLENVENSNLPRGWDLSRKPFTIHKINFNENYWICLVDYDSATDDDLVGCVGFNIGNHIGKKTVYINKGNIEIKLILEWVE